MTARRDLTADDRRRAWRLYAELGSWKRVADRMEIGVTTLREKLGVTPSQRYSSRNPAPPHRAQENVKRDGALYDPRRDGDPVYENEVHAELLGDPPRGRRELLETNAERTRPMEGERHPNFRAWRL